VNTAEFDLMFDIEETHWWYRGRRALVRHALETRAASRRPLRILDVASATGMSFRFLSDLGEVRGIDISSRTIELCARRGVEGLVQADAMRLPFREGSFDCVLALDAFEHFEDDRLAMRETRRVLAPGGLLVATVPAFMALWSPHDEAYHHVRRYRRPQLRARLTEAGYEVERVSYSSMTLFVPVLAMRRLRGLRRGGGEVSSDFAVPMPPPVEALASWITRAEIALEQRVDLPFGVSLFAVARRPAA